MKKKFAATFGLMLALTACHKPSPDGQEIDALRRGQLDIQFWADQQKRNTPLWLHAVEICKEPPQSTLESCTHIESIAATTQLLGGAGSIVVATPRSGTLGAIGRQPKKH
jgi:hypothetical protein